MSHVAWERLDDFLLEQDFAVMASVRLENGSLRQVVGVFDDPYLNAEAGEYDFDTAQPRLTCKWCDAAGIQRGDTAEIEGRVYDVITSPQGDGTGMAVLMLAEHTRDD